MPRMIQTRQAILDDAPALAKIHVLAWRAAYGGIMAQDILAKFDIAKRTEDWQRRLSEPGPGMTLVAEGNKGLAAFCVLGPAQDTDLADQPTGEILALNVHPEMWRQGYGSALCRAVLTEARLRHWRAITLWALRDNQRARSFYDTLGFTPDGAERVNSELIGIGLEELRYRREVG